MAHCFAWEYLIRFMRHPALNCKREIEFNNVFLGQKYF